jgi:hypothetical protein
MPTVLTTSPQKQCASCGSPDGKACTSCHDSYFCYKACHKAAWSQQKKICAQDAIEKAVRRASWLLQELYIFSRGRSMAEEIHKIHWDANRLVIDLLSWLASTQLQCRPRRPKKTEEWSLLHHNVREQLLPTRSCLKSYSNVSLQTRVFLTVEQP